MGEWKETEIGQLPIHWDTQCIENLIEDKGIAVGVMYPGDFATNGVPLIRAGDIKNGRIDTANVCKITEEVNKTYKRTILQGGELLVVLVGAPGLSVVVPEEMKNWNVARAVGVLKLKDKSDAQFISYALQSPGVKHLLLSSCNTTVQPTLNLKELKQVIIPWPENSQRKAIASTLNSIENKINLLNRQNTTLESMAESLFRQWFVAVAKVDWEQRPLSGVANFLNGLACQKYRPKNEIEKLPVLKIKELSSGISENSDWATTDIKPEYIVQNGDVIFAWSASLMVKIWNGGDCVLNQHLFKVTSEEFPKWFYYLWSKHYLEEFISIAASHATTMGHIKRKDLDEAIVLVPPKNELEEMTSVIEPLIDKIVFNSKQISNLTKLRDTSLPKLMSGQATITI